MDHIIIPLLFSVTIFFTRDWNVKTTSIQYSVAYHSVELFVFYLWMLVHVLHGDFFNFLLDNDLLLKP